MYICRFSNKYYYIIFYSYFSVLKPIDFFFYFKYILGTCWTTVPLKRKSRGRLCDI